MAGGDYSTCLSGMDVSHGDHMYMSELDPSY